MFTKVEIENFMCWKKATFNFVPGTNVIIGLSDSGKSAAFQAIKWIITNRPLGDSFRSEWGGVTRVAGYTAEGNVVERVRSDSKNEYVVDGWVLTAFGTEVPEEVTRVLRMDSANIQSQMDPYFLLSDSPGEAAKQLNKAASLDDIDFTISSLKSSKERLDRDIKFGEGELSDKQKQMGQFNNLPSLDSQLQELEGLEVRRQSASEGVLNLKGLTDNVRRVTLELKKVDYIPALQKRYETLQEKYDNYTTLFSRHSGLKEVTTRAGEIQGYLAGTEYVDEVLIKIRKLLNDYQELQDKLVGRDALHQAHLSAVHAHESIKTLDRVITQLEGEFRDLSPDTCPLCGNEMGVKK